MIDIPIKAYDIILHVTGDREDFVNTIREREELEVSTANACGMELAHGQDFYIGVFDGNLGTLVHETGHMVLDVCRRIGYTPAEEQEPFCFLLDHVFMESKEALGL